MSSKNPFRQRVPLPPPALPPSRFGRFRGKILEPGPSNDLLVLSAPSPLQIFRVSAVFVIDSFYSFGGVITYINRSHFVNKSEYIRSMTASKQI